MTACVRMISQLSSYWQDALLRKRILGLIAALLCGDDVRLWHDQLLYKPPSNDDAPQSVGWHTDYGYWRTCSSDSMLTAWVLAYRHGRIHWYNNVRGRQYALAGKQPFELFSSDLSGLERQFNSGGAPVVKVPAILQRGQVTFHHSKTIHGSGPNYTQNPRRSIALHLQPASNQYREIYDNGQLVSHPNDGLTADMQGHPNYADPTYCPVVGRIGEARDLQ